MANDEISPFAGMTEAELAVFDLFDPAEADAESRLLEHPLRNHDHEGLFDYLQSIEDGDPGTRAERDRKIVACLEDACLLRRREAQSQQAQDMSRYLDCLRDGREPDDAVEAMATETGRSKSAILRNLARLLAKHGDDPRFKNLPRPSQDRG